MTDLDLTLHRILKAPRAKVWACWTKPEHLKHWFAPKPVEVVEIEMDLRPGGRFNSVMRMDGKTFPGMPGCYLEVVPEERLTFTDMLHEGFRPALTPGLGFTAIVSFADHADGTEYTVLARHGDAAAREKHEKMGFHDGWATAAEQLETYAATLT